MKRLLEIEWLKLRHYRPFWVLTGMYCLCVVLICSSGMLFLRFLKNKGADFDGIDPTIIPIYDYPDIWQNMTWVASIFKVILGFIVVISVANEASYRTLRQNVIDGLSKSEFLKSKLIFITALSVLSTLLLLVIGLIMGSLYSHVQGVEYMFRGTAFLPAYCLGVITYLTFAMLITLLIPRAGVVIVALFMYTVMFEPLLSVFLLHHPDVADWLRSLVPFLPVRSIYDLVPFPFPRYFLMEIQDYISFRQVAIVVGWLIFNIGISSLILQKKDW